MGKDLIHKISDDDFNHQTNLIKSCEQENLEKVLFLLKNKVKTNFVDEFGYTALMWAVINNNLQIAQALIDYGADIDQFNEKRPFTPLMLAVNNLNPQIIKLLLEKGVNFHQKVVAKVPSRGKNALDIALESQKYSDIFDDCNSCVKMLRACYQISSKILPVVDCCDPDFLVIKNEINKIFKCQYKDFKDQNYLITIKEDYLLNVQISDTMQLIINPFNLSLDENGHKIGDYLIKNLSPSHFIGSHYSLKTKSYREIPTKQKIDFGIIEKYYDYLQEAKLPKDLIFNVINYLDYQQFSYNLDDSESHPQQTVIHVKKDSQQFYPDVKEKQKPNNSPLNPQVKKVNENKGNCQIL